MAALRRMRRAGSLGGSRTYLIRIIRTLNNIAYLHAQTGLKCRSRLPGRSHTRLICALEMCILDLSEMSAVQISDRLHNIPGVAREATAWTRKQHREPILVNRLVCAACLATTLAQPASH
jgi:hypothetical protein